MNRKRTLVLLHIPVWVIAIFIAWFFSADDFPGGRPSYVLLSTLVTSAWMLGSFYLFYCYLVPRFMAGGNRRPLWLYGLIFILIIIPVTVLILFLLTGTSALTLSETLSAQGLLPYIGSVIVTLICGVLGSLYRLLLRRLHTV